MTLTSLGREVNEAEERKWMSDHFLPRYPLIVARFNEALDGCKEILASNHITTESYLKVFNAIDYPSIPLADAIIPLIYDLSGKYEEIQMRLLEDMSHSRWQTRQSIIRCVNINWNQEISTDVLRCGLTDDSHRVRYVSLVQILSLRRKEFLPELEMACSVEKNPEIKAETKYVWALLKYGICLRDAGGRPHLWIMTKNSISGTEFPYKNFFWLRVALIWIRVHINALRMFPHKKHHIVGCT